MDMPLSISKVKASIQKESNSRCRHSIVWITKNKTKYQCQMVLAKHLPQKIKYRKNLNHQHSTRFLTTIPLPQEVFPSKSSSEATAEAVLRIHGRLGLEEPLDNHFVALQGCVVQRCFASGAAAPRPKPAGRTEPRGEKL